MNVSKSNLLWAIAALTTGAAIYEAYRASDLKRGNAALQEQHAALKTEVGQLHRDHDTALKRMAALKKENDDLRLRLLEARAGNARLSADVREQAQTNPSTPTSGDDPVIEKTLKPWAARAAFLKQALAQMPERQIPELTLLKEQDWFDATKNADLTTEDGVRSAMKKLRNIAKIDFDHLLQGALRGYAEASQGQLPGDLSQLKPYFQTPVSDAILQRYSLVQSGSLADANGDFVVAETAPPADEEFDTVHRISVGGISSNNVHLTDDLVAAAAVAYAEANNGQMPHTHAQLSAFLQRSVDPVRAQKILDQIPPNATLDQMRRGR